MQIKTLHELFLLELQEIASFETQILEAMPAMIEKTTSTELKEALRMHFDETKKQSELIINLCKEFDVDPEGKHCTGMEGIIEEGQEMLTANTPSELLDLAMIGIAQKVEHYEIASYGTAVNYAQEMGHEHAQDLLFQTMTEEKASDEKLTTMAETIISRVAREMNDTQAVAA